MYSIYKHTSPSGKVYIGVTSRKPEVRWGNGRNYSENEYFTRAIKKYGWENFEHEILETGLSKEDAEQKEIELIAMYKSNQREFGYNIENGGSLGNKHSEYTKLKISEALKGEKNPRYGKKFPNQMMKSRGIMSEEERKKRSLSHKNQIPVNKKAVNQYDINGVFIETYESLSDASLKTGVDCANISRCLKGDRKSAGGYLWKENTEVNQ